MEYLLRLFCVQRPLLYARSFFGVVDLLAILPTYLSVILPGGQYFHYHPGAAATAYFSGVQAGSVSQREARLLLEALRASFRKIAVFLFAVMTLVIIFGALMYVVEGAANGFTSIPRSVYWAIVTMTTVGYGDISPQTDFGQALAAIIMIIGYGIIAVPTGIVTVELSQAVHRGVSTQACPACGRDGHDKDAKFCKYCGEAL